MDQWTIYFWTFCEVLSFVSVNLFGSCHGKSTLYVEYCPIRICDVQSGVARLPKGTCKSGSTNPYPIVSCVCTVYIYIIIYVYLYNYTCLCLFVYSMRNYRGTISGSNFHHILEFQVNQNHLNIVFFHRGWSKFGAWETQFWRVVPLVHH